MSWIFTGLFSKVWFWIFQRRYSWLQEDLEDSSQILIRRKGSGYTVTLEDDYIGEVWKVDASNLNEALGRADMMVFNRIYEEEGPHEHE